MCSDRHAVFLFTIARDRLAQCISGGANAGSIRSQGAVICLNDMTATVLADKIDGAQTA